MRAMTLREILCRCRAEARKRWWQGQALAGRSPAGRPLLTSPPPPPPLPCVDPTTPGHAQLLTEACGYLGGAWRLFGGAPCPESPIDWHYDPVSGRQAPCSFSLGIDHRQADRIGDVRVIWEKSRHYHLSDMATAYHLTGDEAFAGAVATQLLDWIAANPCLRGVNWISPLEHGIRLVSWLWCWRLLAGSTHHARLFGNDSPVWQSVHEHTWFIEKTHTVGSSANNHLVGEMTGLFVTATAWPDLPGATHRRELARRILEEQIAVQHWPSGINREQAFGYHLFVCGLFLLALLEARRAGRDFSTTYCDRLRCMVEAIPPLTDVGGSLPRYGDSDDALALQLEPRDAAPHTWILECGRALLDANVPVSDPASITARLLGLDRLPHHDWMPPDPGSVAFRDAGLFVLASRRFTRDEVLVLADAGPLGYGTMAAHGHADTLSFTLNVGGRPFLVDPGTCAYYSDPEWRAYFRGTAAHNTVSVNGLDQSQQAGVFLWTKHANARVLDWEATADGAVLEAEHDGYASQPGGPVHRRRLVLADRVVTVEDEVAGKGSALLRWHFHADPACDMHLDGRLCRLSREGRTVNMELPVDIEWIVQKGRKDAGWYSHRFKDRVPSSTLTGTIEADLPYRAAVRIEVIT